MLQFAALFLAQMNTVALAEVPYDRVKPWRYEKYLGSIDEVIHNGATELPLYNTESGKPSAVTVLTFQNENEDPEAFVTAFSTSLPYIIVSPEFAAHMGATVKTTNKTLFPIWEEYKLGGQVDYAVFDELTIGNMTLQNVTAYVTSGDATALFDEVPVVSDIAIGFSLLQSAYQVLPSQGLIKFEGTADGSALMAEYDNPIGFKNISGGVTNILGEKEIMPSINTTIESTIDGQTQPLFVSVNGNTTAANIDASETLIFRGDRNLKYSELQFGGHTAFTLVEEFKLFGTLTDTFPFNGIIGRDILKHYDIAVDIGNQQIAFRPVQGKQNRLSLLPNLLEQAQQELDEARITESADGSDESPEPTAAHWEALMTAQLNLGQLSSAYESAIKRTELKPEDCAAWLDASDIALKLNKIAEAKDQAEHASNLYHSWWAMDLVTRQDIQNRQDKMKPEAQEEAKETQKSLAADAEPVWHYPQPGSCHEADAQLAWAYIASDELEKVLPLYRERIDLDENLAMATAYSAMLQNDLPIAQETLRQAIKLGKGYSSIAEAGLALWYADIGDEEQFRKLKATTQTDDTLYQGMEMDNYRQLKGSDKAISNTKERLEDDPSDLQDHYLYVRELRFANAGSAYDDAVANADAAFQSTALNFIPADQPLNEDTYATMGLYAQYLILTDRMDQAEAVIDRLKKQNFGHASLALVMADYHASKGDMNSAMNEIAKLKLDGRDILSLSSAMLLRATPAASAE